MKSIQAKSLVVEGIPTYNIIIIIKN